MRVMAKSTSYECFLSLVKLAFFKSNYDTGDIEDCLRGCNEEGCKYLLSLVEENHFSTKLLHPFLEEFNVEGELLEIVKRDAIYETKYNRVLKLIADVTIKDNISYVLIKHYFIPYVKMLDIDVHICDPLEILRLSEALNDDGFVFYDFRFFSHPLKLGAKNFYLDPEGEVSVEIYPEIAAGRIIVGPSCEFIGKGIKVYIDGDLYVKALPPTENIYTMLTHDWYSQRIPLSLIVYAMKRLGTKDIERLIELGFEWGTIAAVYTFLKLMSYVGELLDVSHETIDKIGELIKELDFGGKNVIDSELQRKSDIMFPVKIPYTWILTSMPYHIKQLYRKTPLKNLLYDLYSHFTYTPIHVYGSIRSMFSNV
jgi:hypothetical protein